MQFNMVTFDSFYPVHRTLWSRLIVLVPARLSWNTIFNRLFERVATAAWINHNLLAPCSSFEKTRSTAAQSKLGRGFAKGARVKPKTLRGQFGPFCAREKQTKQYLPILRTCCEVNQNSAMKYSSGKKRSVLFAMVRPPGSNITLIRSVFLPSINHADNLPVLVSIRKMNCRLTHIHPSHIVIRRRKISSNKKKKKKKNPLAAQKKSCCPISRILKGSLSFYFPFSLSRHPSDVVFSPAHSWIGGSFCEPGPRAALQPSSCQWQRSRSHTAAFKIKGERVSKSDRKTSLSVWLAHVHAIFY